MNLTTRNRNPFDMLDFFEDMLGPMSSRSSGQSWFNPSCDIEENDSHYMLSFDLPGVKKDDVKIELNENQLVVSGERKEEVREGKKNRHFSERRYGKFQRIFTLPSAIDAERIEADYRDGILMIAVPKAETAKPKQIRIGEKKTGFFSRLLEGDKVTKEKVA